jgi:hypothetical protein
VKSAIGKLIALAVLAAGIWLLSRYLPAVAFWAYCSVAAVLFLVGSLNALMQFRRNDLEGHSQLLQMVVVSQINKSALSRLGYYTTLMLHMIQSSLLWPADILRETVRSMRVGGPQPVNLSGAMHRSLQPDLVLVAIGGLMLVLTIYVANAFLPAPAHYRRILLILVLLGTTIGHLLYLVGKLPQILRSSRSDPYLRFAIIAVADLCSLVLAFAAFIAWGSEGRSVDLELLRETGVNVVTFAKLRAAVMEGASVTVLQAFQGVAGVLYLLVGFKTFLFNRKDFERTDEDYIAIASRELLLGDPAEARRWLDQVTDKKGPYFDMYAAIHLAQGQWERAGEAAAKSVEASGVEGGVAGFGKDFVLIGGALVQPLTEDDWIGFLEYWHSSGVSDTDCAYLLDSLGSRRDGVANHLLHSIWSLEARRAAYPLSYAVLLFHSAEYDQAADYLTAHPANSDYGQLLNLSTIHRSLCLTDRPVETLVEWETENVPEISERAEALHRNRGVAIECLSINADLAEWRETDAHGDFQLVIERLERDLGGDPRIVNGQQATKTARVQRRQKLGLPKLQR